MAKVTIPQTSGDQSVAATALGDATIFHRDITVKVVDPTTVYILRQDDGNPPACSDVIANGYPLVGNSLTPESGESIELFDPHGNLKLSRVFAACSSGSSELRIF